MEPANDVSNLLGLDGSPIGCYVDGKFFKMGQLTQADYLDCAEWLQGRNIEKIIASCPDNLQPATLELKSSSIAKVLGAPVDPINLLSDMRCLERLAFLSARRGGEYPSTVTLEAGFLYFVQHLDKRGHLELQEAVWRCSGFKVVPKTEEAAKATANP